MIRRRTLVYLVPLFALVVGGVFLGRILLLDDEDSDSRGLPEVDAEAAVVGFAPGVNARNAVGLINAAAAQDPEALRAVGLANLQATEPSVRWAAIYALSLVIEEGDRDAAAALSRSLESNDLDERLAAAGGLMAVGDKGAVPVLIALLDSEDTTEYVVLPSWRVARALLLMHTGQDLGLRAAADGESVAATRPAWQTWWADRGASLTWDSSAGKFR